MQDVFEPMANFTSNVFEPMNNFDAIQNASIVAQELDGLKNKSEKELYDLINKEESNIKMYKNDLPYNTHIASQKVQIIKNRLAKGKLTNDEINSYLNSKYITNKVKDNFHFRLRKHSNSNPNLDSHSSNRELINRLLVYIDNRLKINKSESKIRTIKHKLKLLNKNSGLKSSFDGEVFEPLNSFDGEVFEPMSNFKSKAKKNTPKTTTPKKVVKKVVEKTTEEVTTPVVENKPTEDVNTQSANNNSDNEKTEKFLGMPKKVGIGVTIGIVAIAGFFIYKKFGTKILKKITKK